MEKKTLTIPEVLNIIQTKICVPKQRYNEFGKFNFRNLEDITGAVRPLLKELGCTLTFSDSIIEVGGRVFLEAKAVLDNGTSRSETATGYAEIPTEKRGVDLMQITGMASSYARKYAVCGLFSVSGIDDSDSTDTREEGKKKVQSKPVSANRSISSLSEANWKKIATAIANDVKTKDGEDSRTWFVRVYNPSDADLEKMNTLVESYYQNGTL